MADRKYVDRAQADAALLQATAEAMLELIKATNGRLAERMEPHRVMLEEALRWTGESQYRCPECGTFVTSLWSGVKCKRCGWWFCY